MKEDFHSMKWLLFIIISDFFSNYYFFELLILCMGDLEKKKALFEKSLHSKAQKSLLTPFFLKQKTLQFLEFSIINPKTNTRYIVLRNKQCLDYKCLYDLPDIMQRFQMCKGNLDYAFECKMCSNYIRLRDFCYDEALNQKIEEFWLKFNEKEIDFLGVKCYRDGKIDATFKPKPQKIVNEEEEDEEEEEEKGQITTQMLAKRKKFKAKGLKTREGIDNFEEMTIIPTFEDFNAEDIEDYLESITYKGEFLAIFGNSIKTIEIVQCFNDEIMSDSLLAFFLKVLEKREIVKKVKKTIYFSAFIIESFEKKKNSINELESEFLPGLEFKLTETEFLENYRLLALAAKYQNRWIGYVIQREEGHTFANIVDFLDPDITMENTTEFIDILKEFLRKNGAEFIKIVNFEFCRKGKIGLYVDFGVYLMAFFWKLEERFSTIGNMKLSLPKDKNYVKDLIIWVVFKIKELNSKRKK